MDDTFKEFESIALRAFTFKNLPLTEFLAHVFKCFLPLSSGQEPSYGWTSRHTLIVNSLNIYTKFIITSWDS